MWLFCDPMDCSPPGSSVYGIFQARILEWVAISFSRRSSWLRDWTHISCTANRFFTSEPPGNPPHMHYSYINLKQNKTSDSGKIFLINKIHRRYEIMFWKFQNIYNTYIDGNRLLVLKCLFWNEYFSAPMLIHHLNRNRFILKLIKLNFQLPSLA